MTRRHKDKAKENSSLDNLRVRINQPNFTVRCLDPDRLVVRRCPDGVGVDQTSMHQYSNTLYNLFVGTSAKGTQLLARLQPELIVTIIKATPSHEMQRVRSYYPTSFIRLLITLKELHGIELSKEDLKIDIDWSQYYD